MNGFNKVSYYGKSTRNKNKPAAKPKPKKYSRQKPAAKPVAKKVQPKTQIDDFEKEYQEFIRKLREQKNVEG